MTLRRCWLGLLAAWLATPAGAAGPAARPLTVFAAASLTSVLEPLGRVYTRSTGVPVRFSFAASSVLARQVEAGAGADVFFSADREWMDYLEQRHRIQKASRRNVLGNRLALIAPADSPQSLQIGPGFPLRKALGQGRLATGDPDSVPAGCYARQALTHLGVWNDVADRLVRAEDVRHALMLVARGEVPFGIVYETDARVEKRVRIVGLFPADSHSRITYPVALTSGADAEASKFLEFLRGPDARKAFEQAGFSVLP